MVIFGRRSIYGRDVLHLIFLDDFRRRLGILRFPALFFLLLSSTFLPLPTLLLFLFLLFLRFLSVLSSSFVAFLLFFLLLFLNLLLRLLSSLGGRGSGFRLPFLHF